MQLPPSSHFIYIPAIFVLGIVLGFIFGSRATREAYREAIRKRIDWAPDEPEFHLFAFDVERAAVLTFADDRETVTTWDPDRGLARRTKDGG